MKLLLFLLTASGFVFKTLHADELQTTEAEVLAETTSQAFSTENVPSEVVSNVSDASVPRFAISSSVTQSPGLPEGARCSTSKISCGECVPLDQCRTAAAAIKAGISLDKCSQASNPIICCPDGTAEGFNNFVDQTEAECGRIGYIPPWVPPGKVQGCSLLEETLSGQTELHQFPWMAGIYFNNEFICAGTLINEWYVLTAAHCFQKSRKVEQYTVRLGDINLRNDTKGEFPWDFPVTNIRVHEGYSLSSVYDDIAIMRLNGPVPYGRSMRPACLPSSDFQSKGSIYAVGWGTLQEGSRSASLQRVNVPLLERSSCDLRIRFPPTSILFRQGLTEGQLCGGGQGGCKGDSGGPLLSETSANRQTVIGIQSLGKACGNEDQPTIYTNVAYYLPWIQQNFI